MAIGVIEATGEPPPSLARTRDPERAPFRIGAVQHRWHPDPAEHEAALAEGVRAAADRGRAARLPAGADAVAVLRPHAGRAGRGGRERRRTLDGRPDAAVRGPDGGARPASRCTRRSTSAPTAADGLGYNTAIVVAPDGDARSRAPASSTSR